MVALLPEVLLLVGALACLVLGSWTPRRRLRRVRALAAVAVLASLAATVVGLLGDDRTAFSGTVAVDGLSGAARLVVGLGLLAVLALADDEVGSDPRGGELVVLFLLAGAGAALLASTTDLAVLVVGFLLASLPLYGVLGVVRRPGATEATLKAYLTGALLGVLMMLGCALLYGLAGGTSYAALARAVAAPPVALAAGVLLVLAGLLFKAGAVPAHFWVPDAVQGTTLTAATFLTTVPKVGGLVAVARLVQAAPDAARAPVLVGALALAGMTLGNLAALTQTDVRRLLAWSTVAQAGYLLAAAAAVPAPDARPALAVFLAGYAAANLACFAALRAEPGRTTVAGWRGSARARPLLVTGLVVGLLGLVGTPPTAAFVGKALTMAATLDAGLPWLAVGVAVNTVLSLGYYLRWIAVCLRAPDPATTEDAPGRGGRTATAVVVAAAAVSVLLGLGAGPFLVLTG